MDQLDMMARVAAAADKATEAALPIPMLPRGGVSGTKRKSNGEPKGPRGRRDTFIQQLSLMMNENKFPHLVRWSDTGLHVVILDESKFANEVLSHYYTHTHMSSFIRQLNNHNFKTSSNHGKDYPHFSHPNFRRHFPHEWTSIKRKLQATQNQDDGGGGGGGGAAECHCDAKFHELEAKMQQMEERVFKRLCIEFAPKMQHVVNELSTVMNVHNVVLKTVVQQQQQQPNTQMLALPAPPMDNSWQSNRAPLPPLTPLN